MFKGFVVDFNLCETIVGVARISREVN